MSMFPNNYQPISDATPATAAQDESGPNEEPVKAKAVTWMGTYNVGLTDIDVPGITQDQEVVLKVTATSLSGRDLHLWHGQVAGIEAGTVVGHECMGIVDKVGSEVKTLKQGDRVVVASNIACGNCRFCNHKLTSLCDRTAQTTGDQRIEAQRANNSHGVIPGRMVGGQAEYVTTKKVAQLPREFPNLYRQLTRAAVIALFLSDVLPAAYHCVKDTGVKEGDVVGIWGLGPVGQAAVRWAALAGAKRIYAIDKLDSRLTLARQGVKAGVVQTINYEQLDQLDDVVEFLLAKCPEGLDCAIDCTSTHEPKSLLHKAEKALRLESDSPNVINECVRSWEEILEKIASNEFDPSFLITQRIRLEDLPEFYPIWGSRVPSIQKVFVVTQFSPEQAHPGTPELTSGQQLERLGGGRRRSSLLETVQQMGGRRRSSFLASVFNEGKTLLDKALGTAH
ncbi:hypothetical protein QFC19_008689 [Naganishia cerealis]|uniref:Uncharacterized protein n=1 Tax=Naganishia cerealis TaxID=610337 RepID=A0ACC2V149_9TREE|nr:hypothetical protein QFC19_008689 [Naganishia cerealis]